MLGRPHEPKTETINDLDAFVANWWRAVAAVPEETAQWADWPVNEADMLARHKSLIADTEFRQRISRGPGLLRRPRGRLVGVGPEYLDW